MDIWQVDHGEGAERQRMFWVRDGGDKIYIGLFQYRILCWIGSSAKEGIKYARVNFTIDFLLIYWLHDVVIITVRVRRGTRDIEGIARVCR